MRSCSLCSVATNDQYFTELKMNLLQDDSVIYPALRF